MCKETYLFIGIIVFAFIASLGFVFNYNDGSITAKVTIAAKTKTNTSVPSTGEVTGPAAYIGLAFVAAACVCGAGFVHLKKRKEA